MEKPLKQIKEYYDYNECLDYLSEKYRLTEKECSDFWHWLVSSGEINNGSFYLFEQYLLNGDEDDLIDIDGKNKEIYELFIKEFGNKEGEVEVEIYW
jgi:hypothetical protein